MSLRLQAILVLLAGLAFSAFAMTLLTTNAVNTTQRQFEEQIVEEVTRQTAQMAEQLEREAARRGIELASREGHAIFTEVAQRLMKNNKEILRMDFQGMADTEGTLVIMNERGRMRIFSANTSDMETFMDAHTLPLYLEGQRRAAIAYQLNMEAVLERAKAATLDIRRSLASLSLATLASFVATCFLLWKVFKRHMRLVARNSRLGQMAYVGTLAGGLAHEIRNPLHAMNINLQVVEEELAAPREDSADLVARILSRLRGEVGELNQSLARFLEYARPERQEPELVDVRELLAEVAQAVRPRLDGIGAKLSFVLDPAFSEAAAESGAPPPTTARVQVGALRQAFLNIATNAAQAMEDYKNEENPPPDWEPSLAIRLAPARGGDALLVAVRDNGPGIPRENLKKIFDVFFSTRKGGSGFGLAIASRAFSDHGGELWAESKPGEGATFKMLLPRRLDAK